MTSSLIITCSTYSYAISGVVAFALAGAPPPWAKAAPAPASHVTTMNVVSRRIMSSLEANFSSPTRRVSRQGEHDDRRRARVPLVPEIRRTPRCNRDVLPAARRVGHDAAADRTAGVEAVHNVAFSRVEGDEVARQLAGQHEIPRRGRDRRDHRARRSILPFHTAGRRVDRRQPALRLRRWI